MPEKFESTTVESSTKKTSRNDEEKANLEQKLASMEAELLDRMNEIKKLKDQLQNMEGISVDKAVSMVDVNSTNVLWGNWVVIQSVQNPDIGNLYWWNRWRKITKWEVMEVVNKLKEPYNTEISDFIKNKDIEWLQKYLNQKIRDWKIDKTRLANSLRSKRIRFNGSILEDWKFWPQTLETIRFISDDVENDKPKDLIKDKPREQKPPIERPSNPEKMKWNLDWIIIDMSNQIKWVVETNKSKRWSAERLVLDTENFKVDVKNKTISIETRWTSLNSPERAHNKNNRCEYNWATWQVFAYVWKRKYTVPIKLQALRLNSDWLPDIQQERNHDVVRAFASVWNLMNNLKAHGVYNQPWALEEESGWIEVNNWVMWMKDTQLISKSALDNLRWKFSSIWLKFNVVELAWMLTAMKLDLWKIKWDPDIERVGVDPLDDNHKAYVKRYSQTYGR